MVLKRKRSASELTTLFFNSPAHSDSSVESFDFPVSPPSLMFPRTFATTPSHLPSRTMKRFRDNRPSEEEVHQRTLKMLYSAQQHIQNQNLIDQHFLTATPAPAPVPAPVASRKTQQQQQQQQKSLHSFWNINSAAPSVSRAASPPVDSQIALIPSSCEDCGAELGSSGDADRMDVDIYEWDSSSCGACGKHVCSHCSVTNLGEQRRCLRCAGRKTWATSSTGMF